MPGIKQLLAEAIAMQEEVKRLDTALKLAKADLHKLLNRDLPELFEESGIDELVSGDYKATYKLHTKAQLKDANRQEACEWLRNNHAGELIRRTLTAHFDKGEEFAASALEAFLRGAEIDYSDKPDVHWQTLTKWVKEMDELGYEVDDELLHVTRHAGVVLKLVK